MEPLRSRQSKEGLGPRANTWIYGQVTVLRKVWNLGPFDRAFRQLREKAEKLSDKHDVPVDALEKCLEVLFENSRKIVLVGAIDRTVKHIQNDPLCEQYSETLAELLNRKLGKLLLPTGPTD